MTQLEEQPAGFAPSGKREHIERLRARAALAMVIASVAVGFMAGRASVWLVPFDAPAVANGRTAAVRASDAIPRPQARQPEPPANEKPNPPPTPRTAAAEPAQSAVEPSSIVPTPAPPVERQAIQPPPAPEATPARPGVTLINPGSTEARPNPSDPSRPGRESPGKSADGSPAGTEECERRFSSFRPSDGTYQPFGGGARVRCPLLR
jgi:outer membrane biosynthesis protein TonB